MNLGRAAAGCVGALMAAAAMAQAPTPPAPPASAPGGGAAAPAVADTAADAPDATQAAALRRMEAVLRRALARQRLEMPWRDALILPELDQVVWGAGTFRRTWRFHYRVALDPRTRWFYVVRTDGQGRMRYWGPVEEVDGRFVDWAPPKN